MTEKNLHSTQNDFLLYKSPDGDVKVSVLLKNETIWLSQKAMSHLFDCSSDNISLHLKNIFKSGELEQNSVTEDFSVSANDGKNYRVKHYNLDVIISVGYRVKSNRGTQFRIWATKQLSALRGFLGLSCFELVNIFMLKSFGKNNKII